MDDGVHILNNSWGGTAFHNTIKMAFAYAYKSDRVSVAAMGNHYLSGNPTKYPAAFGQGIIAVGASTDNDTRATSSQTGNHIDVVAPGGINYSPNFNQHDIWSLWGPDTDDYTYHAGTSMAAPVVSGIASLLKGYNSTLHNDDIENIIRISADDVNSLTYPGWDQYLGKGRVNAKSALDHLRPPWVMEHIEKTGGSYNGGHVTYNTNIYGVDSLDDGYYKVKRIPVTTSVKLHDYDERYVWIRGANTVGFSDEAPMFGMGWCEITDISYGSADLKTYIYEVYNPLGTYYYGTFPANSAGNVKFCITVLGKDINPPYPPTNFDWHPDSNDHPVFTWSENTKPNIAGYNIYKKEMGMDWVKLNSSLITGTQYIDYDVIANPQGGIPIHYYATTVDISQLESDPSDYIIVGTGGSFKQSGEGLLTEEIPDEYKLLNAYPNPFNPETNIKYQVAENGYTSLIVYNTVGQEVARLVDEVKQAGYYTVNFNASNLSSGMYIYRFQSGSFVDVKKMILMK